MCSTLPPTPCAMLIVCKTLSSDVTMSIISTLWAPSASPTQQQLATSADASPQPTGSIGALALAPSDPNTIYVGSGEGLQRPDLSTGDGMYKSTDGGQTWRHLGL